MIEYIFEFWWMLPVAFCVCLTATSTSVEGAVFFAPIFILLFPWAAGVTIVPLEAVFLALSIEIFGFGSALTGYMRRRLVDYDIAKKVLVVSIPVGMAFGFLAHSVSARLILGLLGGMMVILSVAMLYAYFQGGIQEAEQAQERRKTHPHGCGGAEVLVSLRAWGLRLQLVGLRGNSRGFYGHRHR